MHCYVVGIANYTELNLQICNYAQKQRICHEKSKYALEKSLYDHFCPPRKAANFCDPALVWSKPQTEELEVKIKNFVTVLIM